MVKWGKGMLYRQLGMRLRQRRLQLKLTQEQVAEAADISLSFYGHIERGTRKLSLDTLCKLIAALNCSADEILGTGAAAQNTAAALELLKLAQQLAEQTNPDQKI